MTEHGDIPARRKLLPINISHVMLKERWGRSLAPRLKHLCLPGQRPFATLRVTVWQISYHQQCTSRSGSTQHDRVMRCSLITLHSLR